MPATESTPSLSGRPLSSRIGYGLVKAALRVRQSYAEALSRVGLLPNHHAILSTLDELGPCHQKELASRVVVDPGDIVAYLDSLQESGYVVRERDQSDRRRQVVSITDRKSVVSGKSVSVSVDLGGRRIIRKKKTRRDQN